MKVLIDNGHGKETPGKRSPKWTDGSQLLEWEYTREIARGVVERLRTKGIDAEQLVKEDSDISLTERVNRANKHDKNNTILVSIHCNASQNGKASGWEVHTSIGKTKADDIAQVFWDNANAMFGKDWKIRGDWSDGDGDWESNFAILKNSHCPAILTENFFMDNERDCKFLLSKEGKEQIIKLHVDSILRYLKNE